MQKAEKLLYEGAKAFNIFLEEEMLQKFALYSSLLLKWNEKMNLTAIKEEKEIAVKHFVDSLSVLHYVQIPPFSRVIDVGTGAGFPGVPLAIVRPDLRLTLLDSLHKRLVFLQEVTKQLSIDAQLLHARAEDAGQSAVHREAYDVCVSRAVAPLPVLSEYCLPLVKPGGAFVAMKGPQAKNEQTQAQNAIALLGGKIQKTETFLLSDNSTRTLLLINKVKHTEKKYPRHGAKIAKKPL